MPPFSLDNLVGKVADDLRNRFEIAAEQLRHPGEKGRSREDVVRGFISQYIPARFSLGSGIVVDTGREESARATLSSMISLSPDHFGFPKELSSSLSRACVR